jgi:trans-aconitate methyltransferase
MRWDAGQYVRHARFVADLGAPLLDLLAPRPGERVLDLGCGDGALTQRLAEAGCEVLGVDASEDMVAATRRRGLDARRLDGQRLAFDAAFDAVFSNAALHWMRDVDAVIDGVWRALKPGGRFVAEFGGAGNVAAVRAALDAELAALRRRVDCPWVFPGAEEYRERLERRGFAVRSIACFPRPTVLPGHLSAWLDTFAQDYLAVVPEHRHAAFLERVAERLAAELYREGVWQVDYVRLRVVAQRPR